MRDKLRRGRWTSAALAAGATFALSAASAHAIAFQPYYEYTVAFTGHGSYTRTVSEESGPSRLQEEASWSWDSVYPHILVPTVASSPLIAAGYPAMGLGNEGSGRFEITVTGEESEDCSNTGTLALPKDGIGGGGGGIAKVHRAAGRRGIVFNIVAVSGYETTGGGGENPLACYPSDWWQQTLRGFAGVGSKHTAEGLPDVEPLSTSITLTPADLKHGSVTRHVSVAPAEQVSSDCGSGDGSTCTQSYTWEGTVKFTKHKFKI